MPEVNESSYYTMAGWDDVPHLDEKTKAELEKNTPIHLRKARMRGEPSLGAGAVYPVDPDDIRIAPFQIPAFFRRGFGFDVGWNRTAGIWGAHDVENDIPAGNSPVLIRRKVFPAASMTLDDAVDNMELVGHDFYLFVDKATNTPSVVYRRRGWTYGVITLDHECEPGDTVVEEKVLAYRSDDAPANA